MSKKNQSHRLTKQHKKSHGEIGIFGTEAKEHDSLVCKVSKRIIASLQIEFPQLEFRYRPSISKKEINEALQKIDKELSNPKTGAVLASPDVDENFEKCLNSFKISTIFSAAPSNLRSITSSPTISM